MVPEKDIKLTSQFVIAGPNKYPTTVASFYHAISSLVEAYWHLYCYYVTTVSFVAVDMRCLVFRLGPRNRVGVGFHLTPSRRSRSHKSTPRILVVLSLHTEWLLQFLWLDDNKTSFVRAFVVVFQQVLCSSWPYFKSTPVIAYTSWPF